MIIKCVITTIDNLSLLVEQIHILRNDPFISEIIVVNNGSIDGTKVWLDSQNDLTVINKENNGAGPGRNAGLNKAGYFDYVLMLDGGIRPLIDGTKHMFEYLENHNDADVIGVEIPNFETDYEKAWRRWPNPIYDAYRNTRLSHTAYCLARNRAFNPYRFCEVGPFSEPGWGADDDEMAYQWNDAGIVVHVETETHPYRKGSGSFRRLFLETGIWPNQYGSVYEKRVVWLQQNWAKYQPGIQWGEAPPDRIKVITVSGLEDTIKKIKAYHDEFRKDRFDPPYDYAWKPYKIIVKCPTEDYEFIKWAEPRLLRHHHGDTIVIDGTIIKRDNNNESLWTGDFILELI